MGRLIQAHEGTLERFTGDGLMVFFNDPVEVANLKFLAPRSGFVLVTPRGGSLWGVVLLATR
jgi:class 3 adenylate cyclase